jgi:hypothetical protein
MLEGFAPGCCRKTRAVLAVESAVAASGEAAEGRNLLEMEAVRRRGEVEECRPFLGPFQRKMDGLVGDRDQQVERYSLSDI